ncbi:hypothetical protein NEIMUCOT_03500 [Neisseria mucosa ATCC 25996]|uniref:Uncharacterized protein n=1 Tax=Neisseria mucosa (strain ATCC 25996 / DSM 4631 / NCTC 10774 / M26) TaxID=546266 RepID=D2ZSC0_NEIM2|nr:hypothetical protein NEIMUCOT_03500 [Neisseria mucosa ATCC 25996]
MLIKKLHLVSWGGCPTFGVQFIFSDDLFVILIEQIQSFLVV